MPGEAAAGPDGTRSPDGRGGPGGTRQSPGGTSALEAAVPRSRKRSELKFTAPGLINVAGTRSRSITAHCRDAFREWMPLHNRLPSR